jgi:lactoylglutathione lyase
MAKDTATTTTEERTAEGTTTKARALGINHVALEVGDIEEALTFYGQFLDFKLRGRMRGMAFIDLGDQFIALAERRGQASDEHRHFGLVVDDKEGVRRALRAMGVKTQASGSLDFKDPWGNNVQVVQYSDIQFTKTPRILEGLGVRELKKSASAVEELRAKGLAD